MDIINLTDKIYKLTLFFPKKEPLRYKIRELADEILANFIILEKFKRQNPQGGIENRKNSKQEEITSFLKRNLEVLDAYFEIAKWQNWVSYFDILDVQEKYDKIKNQIYDIKLSVELEPFKQDKTETSIAVQSKPELSLDNHSRQFWSGGVDEKLSLDHRKEKILSFLKEKNKIQVGEISKFFPQVSKRTLRRDFVQLLELGLIERIGEGNKTFYRTRNIEGSKATK